MTAKEIMKTYGAYDKGRSGVGVLSDDRRYLVVERVVKLEVTTSGVSRVTDNHLLKLYWSVIIIHPT